MPIVSTLTGTLASDVTARVRALINDMLNCDPTGDIFSDSQPYVIEFVNEAIDYISCKMIDAGIEICTDEAYLLSVPVTAFPGDPNSQIDISYTGTYDGVTNFITPSLPPSLIMPLKLWCRQSGTDNPYVQIWASGDGLPPRGLQIYNRIHWDWFQNTLVLNGSNIQLDLRVRYLKAIPNITNVSQTIPVPNIINALANICAGKFEASRGNPTAANFMAAGDDAIQAIINRTVERKSRAIYKRKWRG